MLDSSTCRFVQLVGGDAAVRHLFTQPPLVEWQVTDADNRVSSPVHRSSADEFLLAATADPGPQLLDDILAIVRRDNPPTLLLADLEPSAVAKAFDSGVNLWLPRQHVLAHPELLAAALRRLASWWHLRSRHLRTGEALEDCRRQVDRLVDLLRRTGPLDVDKRWYTHRHMLERLDEEVARSRRHGTPLSIAVGEVCGRDDELAAGEREDLVDWTASQIGHRKRRCDIIGRYGPHNFLLLMTHTPAPGGVTCCRRLLRYLEENPPASGPAQPVRAYFGVAGFSPAVATAQRLLRHAEENLDGAKSKGNDHVVGDGGDE